MATAYIRACRSLSWCQSFDPVPYTWTWSGWRRYGSLSGETEPPASGSGEAEFLPRGWARRSLRPWCRVRRNLPLEVGRGGVRLQGSGEAEPAASVSGEAEPALRGQVRRSPRPRCRARRCQRLGVGRGGASPQWFDEAESALRGLARRSPRPRCRARRSHPQGSGEAELARLGVG